MSNARISWVHNTNDPLLVVSYFTDLFYMRDAFELVRSCQHFGLNYVVESIEDRGSWIANTNYKPTFLLGLHNRYPHLDLLWVDADGRIRRQPDLLRKVPCCLAYHYWREKVVASGTVLLRATDERQGILEAWCREVEEHQDLTDQVLLGRIVSRMKLTTFALPSEYCWIYDDGKRAPTIDATPVIEHMQSSRWTRTGKIKTEGQEYYVKDGH